MRISDWSSDVCSSDLLAARWITGPRSWLTGMWGYYHLFCKGERNDELMTGELGDRWFALNFGYKTPPQCGATISSTDAIASLMRTHPLEPQTTAQLGKRTRRARVSTYG